MVLLSSSAGCLSYSEFALFCDITVLYPWYARDSGTRIGTLETFDPLVGRGGGAMNNFKTFGLIMCHYLFSILQILIPKWQIGPALAICHSHHVVALWSCCFHEEVTEIFSKLFVRNTPAMRSLCAKFVWKKGTMTPEQSWGYKVKRHAAVM